MKIENTYGARVYLYGKDKFFDIQPINQWGGVELELWDMFCYWAIIYDKDNSRKKMVLFNNKNWFDDWYKNQNPKPKILFQSDRGG